MKNAIVGPKLIDENIELGSLTYIPDLLNEKVEDLSNIWTLTMNNRLTNNESLTFGSFSNNYWTLVNV